MKRNKTIGASLAALLLLCGCGNNAPASTTAAAPADTTAASTTAASTTAAAPETDAVQTTTGTTPPTEETKAQPETEQTLLLSFYGVDFYKEAGTYDSNVSCYSFDYAPTVLSYGFYTDSDTAPADFDTENYVYSGDRAVHELSDDAVMTVKAGDVIQDHVVASADSKLSAYEIDGETFVSFFNSTITFKDDIELTGTVRFYYDEAYAIASGDMMFIPDASYFGLPYGIGGDDTDVDPYPDFFRISDPSTDTEKRGSGAAIYSDTQKFQLGNLFTDYADRPEINMLLDGANDNVSKKVKVVLSDVSVNWSEQFGASHSTARIKSIELA